MALPDEKLAGLRREFAATIGDTADLERLHVDGLIIGTPAGSVQDRWMQHWDELAVAPGAFEDRATEFLAGLGHLGPALTERWKAYWAAII